MTLIEEGVQTHNSAERERRYLSSLNDITFRHGRPCQTWPCTFRTRTVACTSRDDSAWRIWSNHTRVWHRHLRYHRRRLLPAIELIGKLFRTWKWICHRHITHTPEIGLFYSWAISFLFLLINKFDFLSNSIYANYTARHLILKAAAVAQREKALFFEIMAKIDRETILTPSQPVIIYVVLNLQICLLHRNSELREWWWWSMRPCVCVCRRDTVLMNWITFWHYKWTLAQLGDFFWSIIFCGPFLDTRVDPSSSETFWSKSKTLNYYIEFRLTF